jgi:hypothetical protein
MPTGYTEAIERGCTFEQYLWRCVRAFGVCVAQRDEGLDAPVRIEQEPLSTYHTESRKKAEARLRELDSMTLKQAAQLEKAEREADAERIRKWKRESEETRAKYAAMRIEVEAWEPPSAEHASLKKFMLDQIQIGCPGDWVPNEPKPMAAKKWLAEQRENAAKDIAYHAEYERKDLERAREAQAWLEKLDASVPQPKAAP